MTKGFVSSGLGASLDGGDGESVKKMIDRVIGESSGSRVIGATSMINFVEPVRDHMCDDEKFVSSMRPRVTRSFAMPGLGSFVVKLLACLSLLVNVDLVVSETIRPRGDIRVEVEVPNEAELGSTAVLRCEWKLLGEKGLYSVKWYKDEHEFFRYMPDTQPRMQTFTRPGIKLDNMANTKNSIRLKNLTLDSSGQYKCEVSTEGPSFAVEYKIGNLTIITLPERAPQITGLSTHYAVGENVTANCTAWPSIPKATLQWYINGKSVGREYTVIYPPMAAERSSGTPNSLGLRLEADTQHFAGGEGTVTILCVSYVGSRRYQAEETVHMAHVNNQRLSAGDSRAGANDNKRASAIQGFVAVVIAIMGSYVAT